MTPIVSPLPAWEGFSDRVSGLVASGLDPDFDSGLLGFGSGFDSGALGLSAMAFIMVIPPVFAIPQVSSLFSYS